MNQRRSNAERALYGPRYADLTLRQREEAVRLVRAGEALADAVALAVVRHPNVDRLLAIKSAVETAREQGRLEGLREAAGFAAFYAEERMRLCGDAILHDPVLAGGDITPETIAKSKALQIDGTINSAGYHAANHIAEHLLKLAEGEAAG